MNDYDWWFASLNLNARDKIKMLIEFKTTENIWCYLMKSNSSKYNFNKEKIATYKKIMLEKNLNVVTYYDDNYPKKLKFYDDAPYQLFYLGDIERLNTESSISVVGSRNCSIYGLNTTKIISKTLAENNITIISGMAKGIDSQAHKVAIENGGFTCAVLGSGIDIIYPKENYKLYKDIVEKGCIISEYLPGTPPFSYNFPVRNRIISGLSDIIIIVEAGLKSGSLITAELALEQGKEVMAVPGSIFSKESKGTNKLIQEGAHPFLNIEDISDLCNIDLKIAKTSLKNKDEKNNNLCNKLNSIISNNPIHIDDIIRISNIDINRVYELLFEMQFKNEIMCLSGNYYVRINEKI